MMSQHASNLLEKDILILIKSNPRDGFSAKKVHQHMIEKCKWPKSLAIGSVTRKLRKLEKQGDIASYRAGRYSYYAYYPDDSDATFDGFLGSVPQTPEQQRVNKKLRDGMKPTSDVTFEACKGAGFRMFQPSLQDQEGHKDRKRFEVYQVEGKWFVAMGDGGPIRVGAKAEGTLIVSIWAKDWFIAHSRSHVERAGKIAFAVKPMDGDSEIRIVVLDTSNGSVTEVERLPNYVTDKDVHSSLQIAARGSLQVENKPAFVNEAMTDKRNILGDEKGNVTMHCCNGHLTGYVPIDCAAEFVEKGWAYVLTTSDCVEYCCTCGH